jgi:hypothetical protein
MMLHFDAGSHVYTVTDSNQRSQRVPAVSDLLRPLTDTYYANTPAAAMEFACIRGTYVHRACELDDNNDLDDANLDPGIAGYVAAWRNFKAREGPFAVIVNERPMYHASLRYAGTPDRVLLNTATGHTVLIDIKSTVEINPAVHVQLAGYELLLKANGIAIDHRLAVQLRDDGTYQCHPTRREDFLLNTATFHALLTLHNWRRQYE